jgi:hypothetical protein
LSVFVFTLYISVNSNLTGVNERDQRARHMKGESIVLEAYIPLGSRYFESVIFLEF